MIGLLILLRPKTSAARRCLTLLIALLSLLLLTRRNIRFTQAAYRALEVGPTQEEAIAGAARSRPKRRRKFYKSNFQLSKETVLSDGHG